MEGIWTGAKFTLCDKGDGMEMDLRENPKRVFLFQGSQWDCFTLLTAVGDCNFLY